MAQPAFRGDRLLVAREAAGLSREDLTLQLGLSSPIRIKLWEDGAERPRPSFVPALAAAVGVDPLHLLDVDPDDPPLAALRIAAGLATTQMGRPGMSVMSYQRIEGGRPRVEASTEVVAVIAGVLQIDPRRVEASIRQSGRTSQLIHAIPRIIAFISEVMTLLPGDVILTGTPTGAGPILAGQRVDVIIENLGTLPNPVVGPAGSASARNGMPL